MTAVGFLLIVLAVVLYHKGIITSVTAAWVMYIGIVLGVTGIFTWLWQTLP